MKRMFGKRFDKRGSAILSTTIIVLSVSMVLAVAASASLQRAHSARKLGDRVRAQMIAEAGVADAYSTLLTNWGTRTNALAFPAQGFAGGTYDANVDWEGDFDAVISSTGRYAGMVQVAVLDIKYEVASPASGSPAYNCSIVADDGITWTGCGVFSTNGIVHSNAEFDQSGSGQLNCDVEASGAMTLNGNSGFVNGDADAPAIDDPHGKVLGAKTVGPVAGIPIPLLDGELAAYYQVALANSQVFSGKKTINSNLVVPGGIMWVNGSIDISGDINLTGCFIATGNIKIAGNGNHTKVGGYPAFVSKDGSIDFPGSKNIQGLVYTRIGDISMSGGGSLTGSIICGGVFKKSGGSTVYNYVKSVPEMPAGTPSPGKVYAMAWQR